MSITLLLKSTRSSGGELPIETTPRNANPVLSANPHMPKGGHLSRHYIILGGFESWGSVEKPRNKDV
ncbi:hypothetical protein CGGC5_v011855 [Colletotrichum fructicola Nara gc5]|uniref:Uncharacterized protein n=1 Tax=Colletotrichum fructicola (strain Nara gc5) TaxID=1213859 RepID=A0A7J6IPZ0_COLFN|nr:hypothetical protein CGGC5_v011855 [Colletotrichum fructicola Nara gc5]